MGVDVLVARGSADLGLAVEPGNQASTVSALHTDSSQADWDDLRRQVAACTRCALHKGRTQTVFGVGDTSAEWLIIGEAPGVEEDRLGEPFVGRAGRLLNSMLQAIGMQREEVFIANILKCRPPDNRNPRPEEVACCEPYLRQQIRMINPKIILALGRIAAQNLLKVDTPIGKMRGKYYEYPDPKVPVIVTYHPAYLLRSPKEKRKSWQDLQFALRIYRESK
jgi:uracil-DNA glycosylase